MLAAALFGLLAPAAALGGLAVSGVADGLALLGPAILAVGLMGAGMIGAAATASLGAGIALALAAAAVLLGLALVLGSPAPLHPLAAALAAGTASLSFAARGALFARSAKDKGWWIAVFVVFGEVSILATALAQPGALPQWLLVLLPAQWARMALAAALTGAEAGTGMLVAAAPLLALAGTAAATLLVAVLWPRRWPYAIMFTAWLACSAMVWHWSGPSIAG